MDILSGNGGWPFIMWSIGTFIIPILFSWRIYKRFFYKNTQKLYGKVVVITGASSGLGEALAHLFFSIGCRVILASRRQGELERVKDELIKKQYKQNTFQPIVLPVDLSNTDSIRTFATKALSIYGHIDVLINNGGISYRGDVISTSSDVDYKVMLVNYFGQVSLTKEFLPSMIEHTNGYIIFVSSVQGRFAIPYRSAYTASKHALQAFCDSLRAEVSQHGVKVMAVSPGYIQTKLSINAITSDGQQYGMMDDTTMNGYSPQYVAQRILKAVLNGEREVVIAPLFHRMAIYIRTIIPSLYFYLMQRRAGGGGGGPIKPPPSAK